MLQSFYPLLFYGPLQFYGLVRDAPTIIRGPLHRGLAVGGAEGFWEVYYRRATQRLL